MNVLQRWKRLSEITQEDLRELLKRAEDENFDRTRGTQDSIGEKIACLATKNGGIILVGQSDSRHGFEITGIDPEEFQKEFANAKKDIRPQPWSESKVFEMGNNHVALILVRDLDKLRPCSYKNIYYDRDGDQKRQLSPEEVRAYHLRYGTVNAEGTPTTATVNDLDTDELEFYTKAKGKQRQTIIDSIKDANGSINIRGVIVLAKKPDDFIEGAFIEIQKYANPIGAPPLAVGKPIAISLPAHKLIEEAVNLVSQNLPVVRQYQGARMIEKSPIPIEVIREAITNAVAHRNYQSTEHIRVRIYDDCFDVSNPAVLTQRMWTDIQSMHGHYHPNEGLYNFLAPAQLYEGRGEGIWKIKEEMRLLGKTAPEFKLIGDTPSVFYARIYLSAARAREARYNRLLSILSKRKTITTTQVMTLLNVSRVTALKMLNNLVDAGLLEHTGFARKSTYTVKNIW
ncbi:MAG: ATP-binding protein [Candidatus Micrarchaeota archaeon]